MPCIISEDHLLLSQQWSKKCFCLHTCMYKCAGKIKHRYIFLDEKNHHWIGWSIELILYIIQITINEQTYRSGKAKLSAVFTDKQVAFVVASEMFMHSFLICVLLVSNQFSVSSVLQGRKSLTCLYFSDWRSSIKESVALQCLRIALHHTHWFEIIAALYFFVRSVFLSL